MTKDSINFSRRWLFVFMGLVLSISQMQAQQTYTVTKIEDTNDGVCDSDDCSLREAIQAANNNVGDDVIAFSALFNTNTTIFLDSTLGQLEISEAISINGTGQDLLTIDAQDQARIFYSNNNSSLDITISDLTLANGNSTGNSIDPNSGGGLLINGNQTVTLNNVTIASCTAGTSGAGIYATGDVDVMLEGVTFRNNTCPTSGSAVFVFNGSLTTNNTVMHDNIGAEAIFIQNQGSSARALSINNTTISGTRVVHGTSAIHVRTNGSGMLTMNITNSTITDNFTEGSGSAVVHSGNTNLTVWTAHNSIISGNKRFNGTSPTDISGNDFVNTSSYNIIGTGTGLTHGQNGNIIGVNDPLLSPLADNGGNTMSHVPHANSPAINNGFTSESVDQRGYPRNVQGGFDIGAIESQETNNFVVTKTADTNDGICDEDCSLREAIAVAQDNADVETITFSSLFTDPNNPKTIELDPALGQLETISDIVINGPGQDLLTIDAKETNRIFELSANVTITGLTIKNGLSPGFFGGGGGILAFDNTLILKDVTIASCKTNLTGGAISLIHNDLVLERVTLKDNLYTGSSAIQTYGGSAIFSESSVVTILDSAIHENHNSVAILAYASDFLEYDQTLNVDNSTISGNTAPDGASAIRAITDNYQSTTIEIANSTITDNSSNGEGAAIVGIIGTIQTTNTWTAHNSIISGNRANGVSSDINGDSFEVDSSYNLIGTGGGLTNGNNGNITGVNDPLLAPLDDNGGNTLSHLPHANSPAINNGSTTATTDQIGNPRNANNEGYDIGAIEAQSQSTTFVVTKVEDTNDGVCDADCSLREAIAQSNTDTDLNTIEFSSLFDTNQTIFLDSNLEYLEITAAVTINGPGQELLTVDGQNQTRIFYRNNNGDPYNIEISELTIANGNSMTNEFWQGWGGGIFVLGPGGHATTLINVTITSCTTNEGGGIFATGALNLEGVTLKNNTGNIQGAAIYHIAGVLTIDNSVIYGNSGSEAIKSWASGGDGVTVQNVTINNTTISGNTAPGGAAAIETRTINERTMVMTITNSTITNNVTTTSGAAIGVHNTANDGTNIWTTHNSIISGNMANGMSSDIEGHTFETESSYNLIGTGGGLTNGENGNIIGVNDPILLPLADNGGNTLSHLFYANSPAYNNGSTTALIDQIGNPRNANGAGYDIGAIELQVEAFPPAFQPKVYLQGAALNPNTGEETWMRDALRDADYIPTTSPYADGLTCEADIFLNEGENATIDWIWVELRDENDNTKIVYSQSALLQRDGDVVDVDGQSMLSPLIPQGNYYVTLKHRNHLGIMSANTFNVNSASNVVIDFTDANNEITYGTNAQTAVGMPDGIVGMWAGDVNVDDKVIFLNTGAESVDVKQLVLDVSAVESPFGASVFYKPQGYYDEDIDMDGQVIFLNAGNELIYIKDNVLAHPNNQIFNSVFFTIQGQLP